jgi:hypothetical protein
MIGRDENKIERKGIKRSNTAAIEQCEPGHFFFNS